MIKVRSQSPTDLIIDGLDDQEMKSLIITDNQAFHHVSPNFSNSELQIFVSHNTDTNTDTVSHLPPEPLGYFGWKGLLALSFIISNFVKP
jgi:hypothetical protein